MNRGRARRATSGLLLLALLGTRALASAPAALAASSPRYPNLKTLPPRSVRLDRTDVSVDGTGVMHNVLRFSNTAWNAGEGDFVLRAAMDPVTRSGPAYQRVLDDSGSFVDHQVGTIEYHAAHNHYHFDGWGRYELWAKPAYDAWVAGGRKSGAPQWTSPKTTSCVLDEEAVAALAATPAVSKYLWTGCNVAADNTLRMGLSPGWGDTYDYYRFEQWIDLNQSSLGDGQYVLRSVTDPNNVLWESDQKADASREGDNEATTTVTVRGGAIADTTPPSGTVWVNGVDAQTSSTIVDLKMTGRDDTSSIDAVRISNDGTAWSQLAFTGQDSTPMGMSWDLADTRYGGSPALGPHTVYVQFHDVSGKWSSSVTDTISLVSCAPTSASSSYATTIATDAPVSYWRLGESCGTNAADGRGPNPGTYVNSPGLGQPSLLSADGANAAARFDGVDDNVAVPGSSSLNLGSTLSVEAWIKPTAVPPTGSWSSIVSKPESYSLQFNGPRLELTVIQNGARRRVQASPGAVVAGATYHVVGTADGATERLFLNGTQVATAPLAGGATTTADALHIASWDGSGEFYNGVIDEVAVYNRPLSAQQVANHNTAGRTSGPTKPAAPTNLVATGSGSSSTSVRWLDNATNETGYTLQRSTTSSFAAVTSRTFAPDVSTYADTGLTAGTTYYYRVRATNSAGDSSYSNTASATTANATSSDYRSTVLADGPVSYWRLGEATGTATLDTRSANQGSYVNGPSLGQPGLLSSDTTNTAARFDGSNDLVTVPPSPSLNLSQAFSLETWIRPTAIPAAGSWASVITKQEAYSLQFNGPQLEFTIIQNGTRRRVDASPGSVVAGTIHHVVATYDGTTQALYIDGVLAASTSLTGGASITSSPLRFASWDGAGEFFNGVIDEVAIYDKALTATQITSHNTTGRVG